VKLLSKLLSIFGIICLGSGFLLGQVSFPARGFSSILDDSQAQQKLTSFRNLFYSTPSQQAFHQAYLYQFEFSHFPKRGKPVIHYGALSATQPDSPVLRVDLFSSSGEDIPYTSFLLIRDPKNSEVWKADSSNSEAIKIDPADWLLPWKDGVNQTPFDLLMPFVNWPYEYEKSGRVCGRPAHLFSFSPPNDQFFFRSQDYKIRLAIDDAYDAPLRIEYLDGGILPARTFSLQSFKKIEDQWVVKAIDAKHRDSQSRTRYELKAVAQGLDFTPSLFQPSGLKQPIPRSSISFTSL
jgi:hypothetical protein